MFGTTPQHFLHEQRMRRAHTLLESSEQVAQAAYAQAIGAPSNFSASLHALLGYAPKAIKQRKS